MPEFMVKKHKKKGETNQQPHEAVRSSQADYLPILSTINTALTFFAPGLISLMLIYFVSSDMIVH